MGLADRVRAACRDATDSRVLRGRVLEVLRGDVGFDAHAWLLTDPETAVGSSPLADVPCVDELPELIRLKYLSGTHRWTTLTPGHAVSLAGVPVGDDAGGAWRRFLAGHGVSDVASVVFRDRGSWWGFLDLWRSEGRFSEADLGVLGEVLRPVTDALRRCQRSAFATPGVPDAPVAPGAPGADEPREPAVLLLSPTLEVRRQTAAADAYLRALLPTEEDRRPVPATAYNVAAQLLAVEAGVDAHPPLTRVALGAGRWWTFRAARLEGGGAASAGDLAVTIERTAPRDRLELYCRVHELTERETAVLRCLASGEDTRAVATRLHLSEFTVQDHLKSVFDKTGVRSRRALLARAGG